MGSQGIDWGKTLTEAGIPESPGYAETVQKMKELKEKKAAEAESAKLLKKVVRAKQAAKAGMTLRQRRRWL